MSACALLDHLGLSRQKIADPTHEAYDPATQGWRALGPLPEARDHVAVAEVGNKLFAFGDFSTPVHKGASPDTFEYDPATDAWRGLPPMPTSRGAAAAAAVNGEIHVIGGGGPDSVMVAAHDVYDPQAGRWHNAAPLPLPRDHLAVVAADGKIHVIGGRLGSPCLRSRGGTVEYHRAVADAAQRSGRRPLCRAGPGSRGRAAARSYVSGERGI